MCPDASHLPARQDNNSLESGSGTRTVPPTARGEHQREMSSGKLFPVTTLLPSVRLPAFRMPPPNSALPCVMVTPMMNTVCAGLKSLKFPSVTTEPRWRPSLIGNLEVLEVCSGGHANDVTRVGGVDCGLNGRKDAAGLVTCVRRVLHKT
jgi:hypothetical protein